jgi:organic hydroperoxide reductase OsmC/OhrA
MRLENIMSEHHAGVRWTRTSADFAYDHYNRAHEVVFKQGAIVLPSSSAPAFKGDADRVDPEEAFVSALSSCHMLSLLAIGARKRLSVDAYEDDAVGFLEKGENGRLQITRVVLRPKLRFTAGTSVDSKLLADIHHRAHEECFIANSVTAHVTVEPRE